MPVCLLSCQDENRDVDTELALQAQIVLISPVGGFGDNGYNDLILQGVLHFADAYDLEVSLVRPEGVAEAVQTWAARQHSAPSILLLADEAYIDVARALPAGVGSVLLFETEEELSGAATFHICRYGVSYLAGCMANESDTALVVKACPGNTRIEEAAEGFRDGYGTQGSLTELYLSDSSVGYNMADSTYRLAAQWAGAFVYPLAGGSNMGFYRYMREHAADSTLVAGMDVDCQVQSQHVPLSVVIHINKVIEELLTEWHSEGQLTGHRSYGLASGHADVVVSQDYENWQTLYDNDRAEALRKEAEYAQ